MAHPKTSIKIFLLLSILITIALSVYAELPNDKDLLLEIGQGRADNAPDVSENGNDGTFHGSAA